MKKGRFAYAFAIMAAGILLAYTAAVAAWNASGYAVNFLSMSSFKNSIQEEYVKPEHVDPGQKVVKKVNIKNEGDTDSYVRVKVERVLGNTDKSGTFTQDENLDVELIEIHYNTDLWKLEKDGYWYYKDVLKAGKSTRKPLLDRFYLSEKADNRYKNKEARIIVNLESIQAEKGEMKNLWGVDEKTLGITYQPCTCEKVTSITLNKEHKLVVEGEKENLFANFQNLQPGCSRSQTICVYNETDESVYMQFRAESASQQRMKKEKLAMVQQLLTKYAVIEIREKDKILYKGPVDGNLTGKGFSMKENISLGKFKPGEQKSLAVKLSLSTEMDNQYEALLGKVKWVFSASKAEGENGTGGNGNENGGNGTGNGNETGGNGTGTGGNGTGGNGTESGNETGRNENNGNGAGENGTGGDKAGDKNDYTGDWNHSDGDVIDVTALSPKTGDETIIWFKWMVLFAALLVMCICSKKLYWKEKDR